MALMVSSSRPVAVFDAVDAGVHQFGHRALVEAVRGHPSAVDRLLRHVGGPQRRQVAGVAVDQFALTIFTQPSPRSAWVTTSSTNWSGSTSSAKLREYRFGRAMCRPGG